MKKNNLLRFLNKVEVIHGGCWVWQDSLARSGYGVFHLGIPGSKAHSYAHRHAYEVFCGPIEDGKVIDHLCGNRFCVNPEHLEPVSIGENVLRGNGVTARNKRKKVCKRGHVFNAGNTRYSRHGRYCAVCNRENTADYIANKRKGFQYGE